MAAIQRVQERDALDNMTFAQSRNPVDVARARRLARYTNAPAPVIERDPTSYEAELRQNNTVDALRRSPTLAPYLSDPNNAALAQGDLQRLGNVNNLLTPWTPFEQERYLDEVQGRGRDLSSVSRNAVRQALGTQQVPRMLTARPSDQPFEERAAGIASAPLPTPARPPSPFGLDIRIGDWSLQRGAIGATLMFGRVGLRTGQSLAGIEELRADLVGDTIAAANARRFRGDSDRWIAAMTPEMPGVQRDIVSGLESATTMLGIVATTGGLGSSLWGLTALTGGEAYGRYRQRGGGIGESLAGGVAEAAIENLTERIPLGFLFGRFGATGVKRWLLGYLGTDIVGEQAATYLQDAVDTAIANPNKTWAEFHAERPAAAMSTLISTLTMSGIIGGGGLISSRMRPQERDVEQMAAGVAGQELLDGLMAEAGESQVRQLDPDSFSEFIHQRTDGSPIQHVFIPVEAVDTYLQTEGAETEFFEPYAEQIDEARRLNGDVVVPLGEALARLAGTPTWAAIREDVRVTPGGMSGREAKEKAQTFMQELEDRGAEIAEESKAIGEEMSSAAEVYETVKNELLSVGRGSREAEAIAQLVAARREAAGARLGMSAMEYHKANPIRFREAEPGEAPGENALLQADFEESSPEARAAAEAEAKIVDVMPIDDTLGDWDAINRLANLVRATPAAAVAETMLAGRAQAVIGNAAWTPARIKNLLFRYAVHDEPTFTKSYVAFISPQQFINATTPVDEQAALVAEAGELDAKQLAEETQPIFLTVDQGSEPNDLMWQIKSHEGRHRMAALARAGVERVPVVIELRNADWAELQSIDKSVVLFAQSYGSKHGAGNILLNNLIPITYANRDVLAQEFGQTEGGPLFQEGEGPVRARGQAQFSSDPGAVITLFETANLSTVIHELGHVFLNEMFLDAARKGAPIELKEDVAKLRNWFAANGHPVKKGQIPTGAHELFARGFERYAMEGKAPTEALKPAFAQFRAWLLRIYQVVENLRAPITPEVREVFGRMLATEGAILANQETALPLFKSAEEAGMTEAEFAAYTGSIKAARDEAYDALLFRTMEAIRRRETQRIRDQRANVRGEVAAEINSRPEFVALHLLRTGRWLGQPDREATPVKLNTGWLIDNYGEDVLKTLPRGLPITKGDGLDGDVIAEMVGMASGDQLVKTLIAMREASDRLRAAGEKRGVRELMIDNEVDRIMTERHGDVMLDGRIEEEAIAAINSARQGEIIAGEMRQLAKRKTVLGSPTPYQIAREWAKRVITSGRVVDVASRAAVQRYIRATQRAAKAAETAILAGDVDEAFRQKQAQLLNHALLAEAKAAADQVDEIVARMKRIAGQKARKSVDQDYFDRIHELLERFDFRPRSQNAIDEKNRFEAWAERRKAEGFEVHTPPRLAGGEHYSRVQVEVLLELNDTVESLLHLGRTKQKIVDAQGERDFNEMRDDSLARMEALPSRKIPLDESPSSERQRLGAGTAAPLIKIETLADRLDNGDVNGPMNRLLVKGASAAAILRDELTDKVLVPLAQKLFSLPRARRKAMRDKLTSDRLVWAAVREGDPRAGKPVTMTRMEWIGVALNSGNISNLEKMSKGERWPAPVIQAELNRLLTKEDWDFADEMWRGVGKLWPDIARVERELSGVVPEAVEPLTIETPFGPYQGGYWPVVYDATRSKMAETNAENEADDLFGIKSGIGTPKGHTITRTGAVGPIDYGIEGILVNHIEKVTTRIAYGIWLRDALRFIQNQKISGMIDTKLGPEYRLQIKPWLRRQVSGHIDRRGTGFWEKPLRHLRVGLSISAMGFAYSTGVAQTLGLGFSAGRIGPKYVALGIRKLLGTSGLGAGFAAAGSSYLVGGVGGGLAGVAGSMAAIGMAKVTGSLNEAQAFVFSRSPEMQRRGREVNREVVEMMRTLRGRSGWYAHAQTMSFWHIAMIDRYIVAMPTWLGAHQKALDENMTDEEASAYADKIVRNSQGSGRTKDLSNFQDHPSEAARFLTMFYTPFNVLFNAQWDAVQHARSGEWRTAIQLTTWFMVATVLADALMSGDWPEDEEGEGVGFDDLISWFGRNVFFGLAGGVPLGRDGSTFIERKIMGEYSDLETPFTGLVEQAWRTGGKTWGIAFEDEQVTGDYIKSLSRTTGAAVGLPGGQFGKTGGFLWDTWTGDQQPDSVRDWYQGVTSGRTTTDEEN